MQITTLTSHIRSKEQTMRCAIKGNNMTQHQMDSGEINRDGPRASYTGYEGVPPTDSYSSSSWGQKLTVDNSSSPTSSGQRLALAIISLILWVIVFIIVGLSASSISPDNPSSRFLYPFLIAALLIFSVLVLIINVLFHRRH